MHKIPVYKPLLEEGETKAALAALANGWLGMGSFVGQFENAVSELLGAKDKHVVALSTGHAALHLALLLAGIGPGDEVITPSFNNIADIQAIIATGASPVFCDVNDADLCIDLDSAATVVSRQTKALIAMDYGSNICDHDAIARFADQHGLRIIHDAAHSFGSWYKGKPIGSFSDIVMFSFDPVKTITTIDGGALIVKTEDERRELREMRLIGMQQSSDVMYGNNRAWSYDVERLGFRYHMANLHAAIGLSQLDKMDVIASTRKETFKFYHQRLSGIEGLDLPPAVGDEIVPFMFYVRVKHGRRTEFREFLEKEGVETGIHWRPAHQFTLFRNERRAPLPITDRAGEEIVSLPFHSKMNREWQEKVVGTVRSFFRQGV